MALVQGELFWIGFTGHVLYNLIILHEFIHSYREALLGLVLAELTAESWFETELHNEWLSFMIRLEWMPLRVIPVPNIDTSHNSSNNNNCDHKKQTCAVCQRLVQYSTCTSTLQMHMFVPKINESKRIQKYHARSDTKSWKV